MQKRVTIIGGSMAGLFAAVCLRKQGFDVDIFERAGDALANRGAGIATHKELYNAVRAAGVELREEMGVESLGRVMFGTDGEIIATTEMPQIMTSWGLLYRFLREQIPASNYHNGHALIDISQRNDGVSAHFDTGKIVDADWLIGADGARSTVRALLAPSRTLNYCGYFGWRGLINETLIANEVLDAVAYRIAFGMAPGGHWLGYLVAGPNDELDTGKRWYNWGWYRTGDDAVLRDHLTDDDGQYHEHGIPHHLMRKDRIAAMRADAAAYLAPQIQSIITATQLPFIQAMYDVASDKMRFERVFIIGDAAFTARPHVGLGVSKAADDASKLAHALASGRAADIDRWEAERLAFGHAVVQWGRDLGSYIGPAPSDAAAREKARYYQQPDVLLALTAATDPYQHLGLSDAR